MLKTVQSTMLNMLREDDAVVVGLSGGADSVVLLHVLLRLHGGQVFAVHVNHNLRGADSAADEAFVRRLCHTLGVNLKVYSADVNAHAKGEGIGIEEAGRRLRQRFFEEACGEFNATKIALGHNQDDVAETIIMNLCRGAGLRGLTGIAPASGNIIRPLINISRGEIIKFIHENSLEHITDYSNFSNDYTRNRVRNIILPAMEAAINPAARAVIARNAAFVREDDAFLEDIAVKTLNEICQINGIEAAINREELTKLPTVVARRALRQALKQLRGDIQDISAAHVDGILAIASGISGGEVHLPGMVARHEYSQLVITTTAEKFSGFSYPLQPMVHLEEIGKIVTFSDNKPDIANPPSPKTPKLLCTKAVEYDIVTSRPFLRTRLAGDKIKLEGFSKKLQDFFTDAKIPKNQRDLIPILASNNEVLCILHPLGRVNANYKPVNEIKWISLWE